MPVDINLFRTDKGGDPEAVRKSEIQRCRSGSIVDKVIAVDNEWRQKVFAMEALKRELNALNKEIGQRKKTDRNDACEDLVQQTTMKKDAMLAAEKAKIEVEAKREALVRSVGNLCHPTVIKSTDEDENEVVRTWGTVDKSFVVDGTPGHLHHHEVLAKLHGYEPKKGAEVAGHRGYYLVGDAMLLHMALSHYAVNFLVSKGYQPVYPPFFMRKDVMQHCAELADFEETLYRIPAGEDKEKKDDLFLIATSEQPLCGLHADEILNEKDLPLKYAGYSTCFRKEAGAHGKDTWGIFRIHQFEKIEQFVVTTPEESWKTHEEMIATAEEFYRTLNLPYRVVSIVGGALNDAAAKKYDLEAWFPGYNAYRELVSCSNCTDFQSRGLNARLGHPKLGDREKRFAHMLNATLCAVQRVLCCILENYQTPEGVKVPEVLQPFMGGRKFLPFPAESAKAVKAVDGAPAATAV